MCFLLSVNFQMLFFLYKKEENKRKPYCFLNLPYLFFIFFLFRLDEEIRLHVYNPNKGTVEGECLGKPANLWLLCAGTRQKEKKEGF